MYSKFSIKSPEQRHWRRSGVFIVNFQRISHPFLLLLFFFEFEQVNVYWVRILFSQYKGIYRPDKFP